MRLVSVTVLGTAVVAVGMLAPGTGDGPGRDQVTVVPGIARPGEKVEVSVPGCAAPKPATSEAFTGRAVGGAAVVRRDVAPDTYPVVARCGSRTVIGEVHVTGRLVWPDLLPTHRHDR